MARRTTCTFELAVAKARLAELVRRAATGEEIVITQDHKPVAKLTAAGSPGARRPGSARGQVRMAPDFDAPLHDFTRYER